VSELRRPSRPLTFVCHLLAAPAALGELVGHVEVVDTGEIVGVRDVAQFLALLTRCGERADDRFDQLGES
jgi:hypothetical protein